jgi:hypothetical protein
VGWGSSLRYLLGALLSVLPCQVIADSGSINFDNFPSVSFPAQLDIITERVLLDNVFPRRKSELPEKERLRAYRKELEQFRIVHLEALNYRILEICEKLNAFERQMYANAKAGRITSGDLRSLEGDVREERLQCDVQNADGSDYWKIYSDFLEFYQAEVRSVDREIEKCDSNDRCRVGE